MFVWQNSQVPRGRGESHDCRVHACSDSWRPHGLKPTRLLCPWDFPGKNTGGGCHSLLQGIFPTQGWNLHCRRILCNPMDCRPPGSSVHGILQAIILEWVAILFSSGSSRLRDQTQVSCTAGRFFTIRATRESQIVKSPRQRENLESSKIK